MLLWRETGTSANPCGSREPQNAPKQCRHYSILDIDSVPFTKFIHHLKLQVTAITLGNSEIPPDSPLAGYIMHELEIGLVTHHWGQHKCILPHTMSRW